MIDNLYRHADGGYYCLLSDDASLKHPLDGRWMDAVIYTGTDQRMRSTTRQRWEARFKKVAEYTGDDESVMDMIRRCNPGNHDFDFVRVFESWHEAEIGITGHMLELAVVAAVERFVWGDKLEADVIKWDKDGPVGLDLTVRTEDLQRVLQTYDIKREAIPHGFVFHIRK